MTYRERLETYLRENDVVFQEQQHPTAFTAQDVAASEHLPGKLMAKVVMAIADGRMIMLVLPAPERVNIEEVGRIIGATEVRLAHEDEFAYIFPGCQVGAMPPFGNLYGIPVYVDKQLTEDDTIYFQAGSHTYTLSVKYDDYVRLVWPTVASFTFEDKLTPAG